MITVTKNMTTETGHRLMDYAGKCAHIHGHSYRWEVTVARAPTVHDLDDVGMVIDFKELKQVMHFVIGPLDHTFICREDDPARAALQGHRVEGDGQPIRITALRFNPTVENLVRMVGQAIDVRLNDSIQLIKVRAWETATCYADWYPPQQSML